ncbi:uncharacterized protein LOC105424752 [Pogonomyrmex barbatus]|uniref:Uncharacterized protein LOC105424752 n=1 Tax=Pogonomyrmex barbatus TaxID=144034 RepID=A0A6I9W4N4_9HYME|nr:uncharacterized protein LOC105424752 [Pogonomyrmex barbatus]
MDSRKQCNSLISGAPTRANEKGMCPTCNRQFGIKAYDRHVAWCKDRVTRVPISPATNLAKERLEARMRYRAPALKNRRAINREKYSPGSASQAVKTSLSSPALVKPKENVSIVDSNRESPAKQKPGVVRRSRQPKESPISSGPIKSRLVDRMNSCFHLLRPAEDYDSVLTSTSCRFHLALSSRRPLHFPVPPAKSRITDHSLFNEMASPVPSSRKQYDRNETISQRTQNNDAKQREACSARMQKNMVSIRSQGCPRVNDIAVSDKTLGVTVQPCRIHKMQKDDRLVTWKQIGCKKDNQADEPVADNFSREFQLLDLDRQCDREKHNISGNVTETDSFVSESDITRNNELNGEVDKIENITWLDDIQNLNQTYLIKDSEDIESPEIFHSKWKPIKHSPRVEFYLKDKEDEICDFDQEKLEREVVINNEEVKIEQEELKENNKEDKKSGEIIVMDYKAKEPKINYENIEDNRKTNIEDTEVIQREMKEISINKYRNEENKRKASCDDTKIIECNVEKMQINTENKRDTEMNGADVADSDKLNINKENKDREIAMNKRIIASTKYKEYEDIQQNLSEPDEPIKSFLFDVMYPTAHNVSKKYKKSYFKDLKMDPTRNNNYFMSDRSSYLKHQDRTLYFNDKDSAIFSDSFIDYNQDYLNSKKIPKCKSDICYNDSFELKESIVYFTCNQSNTNNISVNNNNNQDCKLSSKNEILCQNNTHCNSLNLIENIKETSFPASCRFVNSIKDCIRNPEETDIDKERYENDSISTPNKKPERNSRRLNSAAHLFSEILEPAAHNYLNASTSDLPLHMKDNKQFQEEGYTFDNLENLENKEGKAGFNVYSGSCCLNDKSSRFLSRSIIKTEITTGEGLRQKNVDNEFDYDSDNTAPVGERCDARDVNDLGSSITLMDNAEEEPPQRGGDKIFLNASMNFPRCAPDIDRRAARERSVNPVAMKHRIRESMNLLRGSTDSLISSIEFVELASIGQPETSCSYERERTIEIIRPNARSRGSKGLPNIKGNSAGTKKYSERSYWERVSKISRNRLIDLDPAYHAEHKLAKKNPRIRILPPVLKPSLINRRKIEPTTRPAWCNYVRRRPDFNLVLKARTGTSKDYDPFLLAEQQMNDLLSDTSDQSMMGSPKIQQTRDTLYPLSHSSAFVKYPPSDKRSSLIAPPSEFDDLMSNFSSDSTETNSISREIFLPDLTDKDTTNSANPKPVRELGRRVIIDKSKALGVDERRGVVASADRPRKIFEKDPLKNVKPLINRSSSIRASSAPRINSGPDRKISGDTRKTQGSKIPEARRSSDQNLNQRNNNYSSLSGSNLSLNSIVSSSELDVKRSNSMFDELLTSFEEDAFPGLRSLLNNESFDLSSPGGDRQRNGLISDEELSSPDSYKPQDHNKLSNDSAYSSLNRKYSHHGRSANDVIDRLDEDVPRNRSSPTQTITKCKMSKFCHECGQRFPETAKFCCECGVRRLAL